MKKRSDVAPPGAFQIELLPYKPGYVRVHFFANPEIVIERTHWEYDEYQLDIPLSDNTLSSIVDGYDDLIREAIERDE